MLVENFIILKKHRERMPIQIVGHLISWNVLFTYVRNQYKLNLPFCWGQALSTISKFAQVPQKLADSTYWHNILNLSATVSFFAHISLLSHFSIWSRFANMIVSTRRLLDYANVCAGHLYLCLRLFVHVCVHWEIKMKDWSLKFIFSAFHG